MLVVQTELLLQYTSALVSLIGTSMDIDVLQACTGSADARVRKRLVLALGELVTILSIVALSVRAGRKAVLVGGISTVLALLVPRVLLEPMLARFCGPKTCTPWARFGVGFSALFVLVVVHSLIDHSVTSPE